MIPSGIASTTTGPKLTRPPGFGSTDRLEHIAWRRHAVQHPAALAAGPTPITGRPSIILSSSELIAGAMGRSDTARTYTSDEYLTRYQNTTALLAGYQYSYSARQSMGARLECQRHAQVTGARSSCTHAK